MPFFRVENLTKRFGGLVAVNNVSFELRRDEILGIIGPNGAGKTTLLRLITKILKPDSGSIVFNGEDITGLKPWDVVNRGIAGTFQNTRPFRHLPIIANVMVPCLNPRSQHRGEWVKRIEAKAMDALEFVGISDLALEPASALSQGDLKVEYKGEIDLVTQADRAAEALIVKMLRRNFPGDDILTEETNQDRTQSDRRWIIDPLDGTTNYAHRFPFWCVSIAFEIKDKVVLGAIYNPNLNEMFTARKSQGAWLNGQIIKVSSQGSLNKSLLATGFPYDVHHSKKDNLDNFGKFIKRAQAVRRRLAVQARPHERGTQEAAMRSTRLPWPGQLDACQRR